MTLLRDVIDIPTSVGDGDFVVRAAEGADLRRYVVTDQLRENFTEPAGLAAAVARTAGLTPQTYADAAASPPGTAARDQLVSALTSAFFTGAVRSAEYLDLDTGLAVITRHAKSLGYDALVLFLDELILWLTTKLSDPTFVNTEGAKLNKLVESADATRPLPLVSFVARQRNLASIREASRSLPEPQ